MKNRVVVSVFLALAASALCSVQAGIKRDASKIQKQHNQAVVWVEGVLKMQISSQGQTQNQDQEVTSLGTVISDDGLTVVPNSSLNPSGMMAQMMRGMGMSMSGELTDVKLLLADGTEVPAYVVLKDEDLDIAFLAPSDEAEEEDLSKLRSIDLSDSSEPELLDELVVLGRMPKYMNREEFVTIVRLGSIIEKPRTFYFSNTLSSMGVPVFAANGKLVGISVLRRAANLDMSNMNRGGVQAVILPAEDIDEMVQQARDEIKRRADEK